MVMTGSISLNVFRSVYVECLAAGMYGLYIIYVHDLDSCVSPEAKKMELAVLLVPGLTLYFFALCTNEWCLMTRMKVDT